MLAAGLGLAAAVAFPAVRIGRAAGTPLRNIVLVMQENRSFDHYFGLFPGAEGYPDCAPVTHARSLCLDNPPHDIEDAVAEDPGGTPDPARFELLGGRKALTYYTGEDLPFYWALADRFTLCDHYHCSALGPTDINRVYSVAAGAGTLGNNSTLSTAILPEKTIVDRLDEAGIEWACYGVQHPAFAYNQVHYFPNRKRDDRTQRTYADFLAAAHAGTLPPVTWIVTADPLTEHPSDDISWGERFVALTINSVASGPQWRDAAVIFNYDENGGFYDHVAPPQVDSISLGFRVPCVVVSPYAKPGHISSTVYEHSSGLALIEQTFGLRPLTRRDAGASPFADAFDFSTRHLGFVDYPLRHALSTCAGAPQALAREILDRPIPSGGDLGRVPAARRLCDPRPTVNPGVGLAAAVGLGVVGAAAAIKARGRAPWAEGRIPSSGERPPRTGP